MGSPTGVSSKRCGDHGAGLGIVARIDQREGRSITKGREEGTKGSLPLLEQAAPGSGPPRGPSPKRERNPNVETETTLGLRPRPRPSERSLRPPSP